MYIYQSINDCQFVQAFKDLRPDNFSGSALIELYEFLNNLAEETGEPIELDVIAICCEWSEESLSDVNNDYELVDPDSDNEEIFEALTEHTIALRVDDETVVYKVF